MMPAQISGQVPFHGVLRLSCARCFAAAASVPPSVEFRRLSSARRVEALRDQAVDEVDAGREHDAVDHTNSAKVRDRAADHRRGGVGGAQDALHDPRLPAAFGRPPSRRSPRRSRSTRSAPSTRRYQRVVNSVPRHHRNAPSSAAAIMKKPIADHDAEREEHGHDRRPVAAAARPSGRGTGRPDRG